MTRDDYPERDAAGLDLAEQINEAYRESRIEEARRIKSGRRKSPRPVPCGEDGIGYGVSVVGAIAAIVCLCAAPVAALVALWIYGGGR